ncbi:hypothetical protein T484DRAFT_2025994 [Baffinella frigidus]|nr:hypothetical protein T484DRAFT_2025994 [Cryptophyta sp. CCMP2293]
MFKRIESPNAEQGAQKALANTADACTPAADTHKERREREALWRDLAMYADQGAQEALTNKADACIPAAGHKERREREAKRRDLAGPRENLRRLASDNVLRSSIQRASREDEDQSQRSRLSTRAVSLGTDIESTILIPGQEHDAPSVLRFDAKAVAAAAAASPHGSRSEVKLAMKRSISLENFASM